MSKQAAVTKKEKSNDEKANILDNESNAMSLGKTKVAYSRSGEEEDTLIVRDLYSGTRFDRFGVNDIAQLEWVFYQIIGTLFRHRTLLFSRMRYDGDKLLILLDGLSDEDHDGIRNTKLWHLVTPSIKIELNSIGTNPQLSLIQYADDEGKTLKNGVYLYVSEAVKLVKHMNDVFAFSKSSCLSVFKDTASKVEKYTSDDFF